MEIPTSGSSPKSKWSNDGLKHAILGHYSAFVSDVDPVMLSDHLIENGVVSVEEWNRMKAREVTRCDVCRALLNHLCLQRHPKAFLVVRKALEKEDHWLLQEIDRPTQRHSHLKTSNRDLNPDLEKTEEIIASLLLLIDKLNDENNLLRTRLQESQASVNKTKGQSTTGESSMPTNQQMKPMGDSSAKTPSPMRRSKSPVQTKTTSLENNENSVETIVTNNHQHIKAFWEKRSKGEKCKPIVETVQDKTVRCAINTGGGGTPKPAEVNAKTTVPMSPSSSSPVIRATIEQVTTNCAKVNPFILKQLMEDEKTTTKTSQKNIIVVETVEKGLHSQHQDISTTDGIPHSQSKRFDLDSEKDNEFISGGGLIDPKPKGRRNQSVFHPRSATDTILPPTRKKKTKSPPLLGAFQQNT